jgi:GT2 family glycosyltransferase
VPVPEQALLDAPSASTDVAVGADGHHPTDDPELGPVAGPEGAPAPPRRSSTRVLAVLVAHDGGPWLDRTLEALAAQSHEALDVVAVDNGSTDGTRARLQRALGEDAVLVADRDLGFGAAVSMALDARAADVSPYVLLLHDDLALTPDAVSELAGALDEDPRLAVVGPKLLVWEDPRQLQAVGWTVDLTGRADSGVDEHELDQGQRDVDRRTLYVSTAGMMLRREVFDRLGRFDRRFHLFRDDLDLCWRVWLAGSDVEVVPEAVGVHAAAATNYHRLGQTRVIGPRYFAERNTLATLLKNYGPLRLVTVVPLYFLVGIAKILGFLLTRRFSDAWLTIRAWLWNGLHLLETRRLRKLVQAERRRPDAEVRELFGRIVPRVRAYAEAIADWVAGGDVSPETDEGPAATAPTEPERVTAKLVRFVRERPVLVVGALLTVLVLVGAAPLLGGGSLRGGELAPWPASPRAFLADHASAWHTAAGLGTDTPPSPAQALLGVLQWLAFGSAYVASRVLLLGSLLVAWILALRATQRYSARKLPRVAAATAYVLSPPVIAALLSGQVGALVVVAALPGLVAGVGTLARRTTHPATAWRAAAGAALAGAIAAAFVPHVLPVLLVAGVVLLVAILPGAPRGWRGPLTARVLLATFAPLALLGPWAVELFAADGPLRAASLADPVGGELWRWVLLAPPLDGFPAPWAGTGFVLAGVLGVLFGWRRQAGLVAALWMLAIGGAAAGWWLARTGAPVWPGLPLVLSAAAYAGLLAVAFATGEASLGRHTFGWRQLAAITTTAAVVVSLVVVAVGLVEGPQGTFVRDRESLPAFVTAAATPDDPFLVLLLADVDDVTTYEVVPGSGPTMAATGVVPDADALDTVDAAVADLLAGRDVDAASTLGQLGVRYVVVPDGGTSDALDDALRAQDGLEPRPVATGRVLAVTGALPRASAVPADVVSTLTTTGRLPADVDPEPLTVLPDGRIVGDVDGDEVVLVNQPADADLEARVDGRLLASVDAPVTAFAVPEDGGRLEIVPAGQGARALALTGQLLVVLLVVSLMLRPPGFARAAEPAGADASAGPAGPDGPDGPDGERDAGTRWTGGAP